MDCDAAQIGQHTESFSLMAKHELNRLPGVVRYRNRCHGNTAYLKVTVAVDHLKRCLITQLRRSGGTGGHIQWQLVTPPQHRHTPAVVAMLMSKQNRRQLIRMPAYGSHTARQLNQRETTIDQQAGVCGFHQGGVAFTATSQRHQAHVSSRQSGQISANFFQQAHSLGTSEIRFPGVVNSHLDAVITTHQVHLIVRLGFRFFNFCA